jgi:hypothetical protein
VRFARRWACAGLVALLGAATASADKPESPPGQSKRPPLPPGAGGHGKGTGGRTRLPRPAPGGGTGSPSSVAFLAAWLDDAETLGPGEAAVGLSAGRTETPDGGQTDAPVVFAAVGIASRVQLSGSSSYYRASYDDGYTSSGLGNTYLAGKAKLIDPGTHVVGLAVSPVLEVLSDASLSDTTLGLSRVNWALPVSIQVGRGSRRALASAGYFSRGAVFLAAGLEQSVSARVALNLALSYMYATSVSETSDLAGLSRSRLDASAGVLVALTPVIAVSGALGRTVSSLDQNGATLLASASISYAFGHARHTP